MFRKVANNTCKNLFYLTEPFLVSCHKRLKIKIIHITSTYLFEIKKVNLVTKISQANLLFRFMWALSSCYNSVINKEEFYDYAAISFDDTNSCSGYSNRGFQHVRSKRNEHFGYPNYYFKHIRLECPR